MAAIGSGIRYLGDFYIRIGAWVDRTFLGNRFPAPEGMTQERAHFFIVDSVIEESVELPLSRYHVIIKVRGLVKVLCEIECLTKLNHRLSPGDPGNLSFPAKALFPLNQKRKRRIIVSSKLLIKDAAIVTMNENQEVIESGNLLIEDDLIKSVSGQPIKADDQTRVIPGEGKVVIPGLINLHNHAAMSLFRSYADDYPLMEWLQKKIFPAEARLTEEDVYWGTSLAVMEMLRGGTTTFVDMYYFMEQTARACQEGGIRALLSQVFIGLDGGEGIKGLREAINFVENWQDQAGGRIRTILGPHAPYTCPPDFLKQVLSETEHLNTLIHIHLSESRQEVEESLKMHGKTPVALMDDLGMFERPVLAAHCVHLNDEDIEILCNQKVGISHNPGSNLKLGNGIAPLKKLLDQNACIGLGTDGAASNNNLDMFEEVMLAALLQKGINEEPTFITADEAFSLATSRAAKALQIDNLGMLKEGFKADVVLLDFKKPHLQPHNNPVANIVYSASANDVETVVVDGKLLYDRGEFFTLDEERIYYEANRCAKRLRQ